jgi:fructose-1,6-bisphosphatase II
MDRNLALELVRVTEAAALACGRWVGKGDKTAADRAATEAMRRSLESIEVRKSTSPSIPWRAPTSAPRG